jgi:hypothetical protein
VARVIAGHATPFADVPFFWSQHYDVAINHVGHADRWDAIEIDGSLERRDCTIRYKHRGKVLAVATVSRDRASLEANCRWNVRSMIPPRELAIAPGTDSVVGRLIDGLALALGLFLPEIGFDRSLSAMLCPRLAVPRQVGRGGRAVCGNPNSRNADSKTTCVWVNSGRVNASHRRR